MARVPTRRRNRGENPNVAAPGGFGANPIARQEARDVVDFSMAAHMQHILESNLVDDMTIEEAIELSNQNRLTDRFDEAFKSFRRQKDVENRGEVIGDMQIEHEGGGNRHADPRGGNLPAVRRGQNLAQPGRPRDMRQAESWMQLRRLPTYMLTQIRKLGRDIFAQYTDMPIEDINTLGTITHSQDTVEDTIRWISQNGVEVGGGNIDFGRNVPGYTADTSLWEVDYFTFLVVRDNHGMYVYGWPEPEKLHLKLEANRNVPQLR